MRLDTAEHRSRPHDAVALRSSAPILKGKVDSGDLQVIGGYYSLDSGAVTFVNGTSPKDGQSLSFAAITSKAACNVRPSTHSFSGGSHFGLVTELLRYST
jgi:hypothetical protein